MTYEQLECIAILMESCNYTEAEALQAAQRQAREAESHRMLKEKHIWAARGGEISAQITKGRHYGR